MGRLLWHLPEPYQHLVRAAGVYANRVEAKRQCCRDQLKQASPSAPGTSWQDYLSRLGYLNATRCPICGGPLVVAPLRRQNQNSYKQSPSTAVFVQLDDGAYIACVPRPP
jgi:hypothetical protein